MPLKCHQTVSEVVWKPPPSPPPQDRESQEWHVCKPLKWDLQYGTSSSGMDDGIHTLAEMKAIVLSVVDDPVFNVFTHCVTLLPGKSVWKKIGKAEGKRFLGSPQGVLSEERDMGLRMQFYCIGMSRKQLQHVQPCMCNLGPQRGSRSQRKQWWWLCSGYSGGDMTGDGHSEPVWGWSVVHCDWPNWTKAQTPGLSLYDWFWDFREEMETHVQEATVAIRGIDAQGKHVPRSRRHVLEILEYKAESIHNYVQGMCVAVPELPEAIKVSMAAADLAIAKLQSLHREHKPQMTVPRIFMVLPGAWVPSNMEGYGERLKWMTQDNDNDDGADDHEDDMQGSGDDSNDRVPEDLDRLCQECSREGRAASCEGEPHQRKNPLAPQVAASLSNKCAKLMPPTAVPAPSPTIPSPELPIAPPSQLFLGSMTPSSVQNPDHALTPANFSPLVSVDKLQELFEGGFLVTTTGLLQDDKMLVMHEEMPVMKEESPIETVPQETPEAAVVSPSPPHDPSSSLARMTLWLHALDECIKWLEEIVEMNEAEIVEMHEDLVRFMAWVSRFRSAVLEQWHQLREIRELWRELPI
ncbi:hypothetical protein EDC04DRAFT_2614646 [Pisolithus marmoratus]|nr:hypothetical protein EDC04DRAFT_2614646 [Pisolithus marmoratus]